MRRFLIMIICSLMPMTMSSQMGSEPLASPFQGGAYGPAMIGVRDNSNPGAEGWAIVDYNIWLWSNAFIDSNGDELDTFELIPGQGEVPFTTDISGYINSLLVSYTTPKLDWLGNGQMIFILSPNYGTAHYKVGLGQFSSGIEVINGGTSGFGDLTVAPLWLSWAWERFDLTGGYMFVAPTGKYETGDDNSVGVGYWSHIIQANAFYYSADKSTAFTIAPTYEFHGKIKDVDVKAGSRFALEYGISQYLSERFELSVQGGHIWQVGEDSGSDVYWDTSVKDRLSMVGLGMGYWLSANKIYSNLKWMSSYGEREDFEQNIIELQLIFVL